MARVSSGGQVTQKELGVRGKRTGGAGTKECMHQGSRQEAGEPQIAGEAGARGHRHSGGGWVPGSAATARLRGSQTALAFPPAVAVGKRGQF